MKHIPAVLTLCMICLTSRVWGYDQQVSSSLSVEGYSVYSRYGELISRRRVVEDLQLGAWNVLSGESDPYYRGPRLALYGSLRLFGDMSIERAEADPSSEEAYIPGLTPLELSAITAYLDLTDLWEGRLDLRAGRQIRLDTLGFFAFDGGETRIRLPLGITFDTYLGTEVRGGHILGYDFLELDGTDRGGRREMDQGAFPDRKEPGSRLAIGTELTISPKRWLEVATGFRAVGLSSGGNALADERVGGRLMLSFDRVRADARAVFSPLVNAFTEADVEIGVTPVDLVTLYADYHHFEPVFEGDSIFNVFDTSPQNDLGGRVALRVHRSVNVASWGFVRLVSESAGITGDAEDRLVSGAGGGIGGNYRTRVRAVSLRLSYLEEWGESRLGAELSGGQGFLNHQRLWLSARLSFWRFEDDFSARYQGNTAGYVLSGRFRLAHQAHLLTEFEHYMGSGRNKRFTAFALLRVDLWR